MKTLITKSEQETIALASRLARRLKDGDIVLLQGELGSGKTTFARGLAQTFGVRGRVISPTFVLMHVHRLANSRQPTAYSKSKQAVSRKPLAVSRFVHCDAYRIKNPQELMEAGLADWLGRPDTIVVVEWGEKIKPLLRGKKYTLIKFRHGKTADERIITRLP